MNKYLIASAIITIAGSYASAQNILTDNPDNKIYFGLRASGEITCPGKVTSDNVGVSFFRNGGGAEFGGIVNFPVKANFYIEPGVKFYFNQYSLKKEYLKGLSIANMPVYKVLYNKYGMRIPVMAGYHFDFTNNLKLSVFTGPEVEIGFTANEYTYIYQETISDNLYEEDRGMKRVDLLWQIGAGITYRHLYFGISSAVGMLNLYDVPGVSFHENRATFTFGYNF